MNKKLCLSAAALLVATGVSAQKKDFNFDFYGQIRADVFYNTRACEETVDGLFNSFPKDRVNDATGKDLNGADNSGFYMLYSRVGVDVTGPALHNGKIKTSAKVEADFRGSSTTYSILRLRHAYLNLDFGASKLLVGQTWHPLYGEVSPETLSLEIGAPYNPFSRAPQVRYRLNKKAFQLTAAALWQMQYLPIGVTNSGTEDMIKHSNTPEFYLGVDYKSTSFQIGVGADLTSLTPRTQSTVLDKTYKVNERITAVSYEIHAKYKANNLYIGAKSVLGNNLTQTSTIGGFAVSKIDAVTGKQTYTPLRVSSSWLDISYGKTWRPTLFAGYVKNLGASKDVSTIYGRGTKIDQVYRVGGNITYNLPHWKFGLEYMYENAAYGTPDKKAKVKDTHTVDNHRVMASALFMF